MPIKRDPPVTKENNKHKENNRYRVPYGQRRPIKKYLVPRITQLHKRKRRNRLIITVFLMVIVLGLSIYAADSFIKKKEPASTSDKAGVAEKSKSPSAVFAVFGVEDKNIKRVNICGFEKNSDSISIITIDENTYIPMLGMGLQKIGDLNRSFSKILFYSLENTIPYSLDFRISVPLSYISDSNLRKNPEKMFFEVLNSQKINKTQLEAYSNQLKKIKSVELIPSPTKLSNTGKESILVLDEAKLKEATKIILSDTFKEQEPKLKILILNGSGEPAVAAEAASILIDYGYGIVAVKNAESFDYATTKIELYSASREDGEKIKKILKTGEISETSSENNVIDAAIIVGKDFSHTL